MRVFTLEITLYNLSYVKLNSFRGLFFYQSPPLPYRDAEVIRNQSTCMYALRAVCPCLACCVCAHNAGAGGVRAPPGGVECGAVVVIMVCWIAIISEFPWTGWGVVYIWVGKNIIEDMI